MSIRRTKLKDLNSDQFNQDVQNGIGNWTVSGLVARVVVGIIAIVVVGTVIGFASGWFNAAKQVISPANVKAQYARAYTDFESLKATAGNVCSARKLVANETDPAIKAQRQDQELGFEANYRRIEADYDEAYKNAFEAKHVGPSDIPSTAPGLEQAVTLYCT